MIYNKLQFLHQFLQIIILTNYKFQYKQLQIQQFYTKLYSLNKNMRLKAQNTKKNRQLQDSNLRGQTQKISSLPPQPLGQIVLIETLPFTTALFNCIFASDIIMIFMTLINDLQTQTILFN
ncbi:transmembrane protein, putative (macronuclear) [Tetrahymena thermophila SB210]|uniref:Transmembrane protein, putative n=1 Tax=Tetrahymena thermophila (strain SB210) TaxID=312017 RepID=Q235K6_TETTS|nr:transmembrane protein, putative [Tetrahymena thermophila SB210]EAR92195.2 transmembrane protein, putative [Tetrahymena thermophila SB210]|eukprot:XP_001012440.2 transmembrane protein, putative [Tetrahymena thermophila SB210]